MKIETEKIREIVHAVYGQIEKRGLTVNKGHVPGKGWIAIDHKDHNGLLVKLIDTGDVIVEQHEEFQVNSNGSNILVLQLMLSCADFVCIAMKRLVGKCDQSESPPLVFGEQVSTTVFKVGTSTE